MFALKFNVYFTSSIRQLKKIDMLTETEMKMRKFGLETAGGNYFSKHLWGYFLTSESKFRYYIECRRMAGRKQSNKPTLFSLLLGK